MTSSENFNLSEAVALYVKRYPGKDEHEFDMHYGPAAEQVWSRSSCYCVKQ